MKKIKLLSFGFILIGILSGCMSERKKSDKTKLSEQTNLEKKADSSNFYRKNFAGGYTIEVKGVSSAQEVEVYALNENGGAIWLWVENDGSGGASVDDEKKGTWTATNENGSYRTKIITPYLEEIKYFDASGKQTGHQKKPMSIEIKNDLKFFSAHMPSVKYTSLFEIDNDKWYEQSRSILNSHGGLPNKFFVYEVNIF